MIGDIKRKVMLVISLIVGLLIIFISVNFLTHPKEELERETLITIQEVPKDNHVIVGNKITNRKTYNYQLKKTKDDADIEIVEETKPLFLSINGVKHEVDTSTVKEEHKLDKGKLVVTEERQVVLDLKIPEQPRFKKGIYIETDESKNVSAGLRLSYQTKEFDVDLKADLYNLKKNNRITLTGTKWF